MSDKVVGHDCVASEKLQSAPRAVDRLLALAFNGVGRTAGLWCWDEAEALLLPKTGARAFFTALRPITVLAATQPGRSGSGATPRMSSRTRSRTCRPSSHPYRWPRTRARTS